MFAAFNRTQSAQFGGSGTSHVIACWLLPFLRTRDRAFKPLNERLQLNAATARLQGSMDSEKARAQAGFPCSISTCWACRCFCLCGEERVSAHTSPNLRSRFVTTRIQVLPSGIENLRAYAISPPSVPVIAMRPLLDIFDKA